MTARVYVIGAGLAGLSAATALAARGHAVELIEGAAQAGGRCRSYVDPVLGTTIDNGNHLVLSGNHATFDYLRRIGAEDRLVGPEDAEFSFCDVRDGARWTVRPNPGPIGWWTLMPSRRPPEVRTLEFLDVLRLLAAGKDKTIGEVIACSGPLWERLLRPLLIAALNTEPEAASAALAAAILRETLAKGGRAYRPRIAEPSLAAAFVEPALAFLARAGVTVRMGQRVQALHQEEGRLTALSLPGQAIELDPDDRVILAVPPWAATDLLPGVAAPDQFEPIVNGHFLVAPPAGAAAMVGVIGGSAEWVFAFTNRISVTVSAAGAFVDQDRKALAHAFWDDIRVVHDLGPELPPWQIVKERRATFAATPEQATKRAPARTALANLVLAGDWTATGLPATIEGAIRSGHTAAAIVADMR